MTREEFINGIELLNAGANTPRIRSIVLGHDAEQRAEIARLREALTEIIEKCEDEDWEYMFGDVMDRAKAALKETL